MLVHFIVCSYSLLFTNIKNESKFNFVNYVFLMLCMFRSGYSVLLCCSMYCLCVNAHCTTATGCEPNCN
jgi:hypothetical protein